MAVLFFSKDLSNSFCTKGIFNLLKKFININVLVSSLWLFFMQRGQKMFKKKFNTTILQDYPYLGSTNTRVLHSTKNYCEEALLIEVNNRWYTKTVPMKSGYEKCSECFPNEKSTL